MKRLTELGNRKKKASQSGQHISTRDKLLSRRDHIADALTPQNLRKSALALQRSIRLTKPGALALVAAIITWLVGFIVAGKALYIFAYGAVLLLFASYLLAPRKLKLEGVRAGLYPRAQEGDRIDVEVQLTAKRRVPAFILEERLPERLGTTVKVPIPKLSKDKTVSHRYGLRAARRGVYEVGPLVAVTSDPLGFTQRENIISEKFDLFVHPRIEFVSDRPLSRQFEDPPIRPPVSKPWPSGLEFYGMREYVRGDDLRRVVWRASARTGKLMVREAEQGITDHVSVILDTYRGHHSRDGDYSESFETGVRAAASLCVRHLREGYVVKVETNAGPLTRSLRGATSQMAVMDAFTRVELSREQLSSVIMRLVTDPRRNAHNIFITPKLGHTEAAQLKLLLNKGVSILVVALLWDDENADTIGRAMSLGCQVAGVHPGQDLSTALYHDIGAGNR
ncbi:MAG: DUF58 domain-containing protein [Actinomycetota bacterium]